MEKPTEVLEKRGMVYREKEPFQEVLCKPKLMPIKSVTLEKLEEMQREAYQKMKTEDEEGSGNGADPSS